MTNPIKPLRLIHPIAALLLIGSVSGKVRAAEPSGRCQQPSQGRFAGIAIKGNNAEKPGTDRRIAHVMEERWLADKTLQGEVSVRVDQNEFRQPYSGTFTLQPNCVVQITRVLPWGKESSNTFLDLQGHPVYEINSTSGIVVTTYWQSMTPGACAVAELNGLALGRQIGYSWVENNWQPNGNIERENWQNGHVQGSSLASQGELTQNATYSGALNLQPGSCWGTLTKKFSDGTNKSYRILVVKGNGGASGYIKLQNDPNDLGSDWFTRYSLDKQTSSQQ